MPEWAQRSRRPGATHSLETHLLVLLTKLRQGATDRLTGVLLGISPGSVHNMYQRILVHTIEVLDPLYLPPVTRTILEASMASFNEMPYNLPGVCGAMDGIVTGITKVAPYNKRQMFNYKHKVPSVNSLGVCDARGRFIYFNAAFPGEWPASRHCKRGAHMSSKQARCQVAGWL